MNSLAWKEKFYKLNISHIDPERLQQFIDVIKRAIEKDEYFNILGKNCNVGGILGWSPEFEDAGGTCANEYDAPTIDAFIHEEAIQFFLNNDGPLSFQDRVTWANTSQYLCGMLDFDEIYGPEPDDVTLHDVLKRLYYLQNLKRLEEKRIHEIREYDAACEQREWEERVANYDERLGE